MKNIRFRYYYEKYKWIAWGSVFSFAGGTFLKKFPVPLDAIEKVFDIVITITSISIGFIGVLLGIIATIKQTKPLRRFWRANGGVGREMLKEYFS